MTSIQRTYTFDNATKYDGVKIDSEIGNIVSTWNNHDQAVSPWTKSIIAGVTVVGSMPSTSLTATATTGGTLAAATYIYKLFPFNAATKTLFPGAETSVIVGGANNAVSLSWSSVLGASTYRITRSLASGSSTGYFQTTNTTLTDSGQAFTSASGPVAAGENDIFYVSGSVHIPAGIGSINFHNFTDGLVSGHVGVTSAGEFEMSAGKGIATGHFLIEDASDNIRILLDVSNTTPVLSFQDGTNYLDGVVQGLTLSFQIQSSEIMRLTSTGLAIKPTTNQLVLGATRTVTITAPTPATASRAWTIPDISSDGTFAALEGTQTFSGSKTFSSTLTITGVNTDASTTTGILYFNPASPANDNQVIRFAGSIATDQLIYSAKNTDDIRFAGTSGGSVTDRMTINSSNITFSVNPKFGSGNTTGGGSAALGANCPAVTATAPYTWATAKSSDGSTVYFPLWK